MMSSALDGLERGDAAHWNFDPIFNRDTPKIP
jgi:hypothetical protein